MAATANTTAANPYGDFMSQFMSYLTNPAAYGSIPNIPAFSTDTSTTVPTTQLAGYAGLNQQASDLAGQQMHGQLGPDVIANMATAGAERGVSMGSPGSPNANAAYLRALGLDSSAMQDKGMQNYLSLLQSTPRNTTTTNVTDNGVLKAEYAAAPNPMAARLAELAAQYAAMMAGKDAGGDPTDTTRGGITTTTPGRPAGTTSGAGGNPYAPPVPPNVPTGPSVPSTGRTPGFAGMPQQITQPYSNPMGGQYVNNGNGSWTNNSSGQMVQNDPSIPNTGYNPINDTSYNTGSVYDSYGNYNPGYGSGMGGAFDPTYYDPTATDQAYSSTEGANALQQFWLGANQDWSNPLGASSYQTPNPEDFAMQGYSGSQDSQNIVDVGGGYSFDLTTGEYIDNNSGVNSYSSGGYSDVTPSDYGYGGYDYGSYYQDYSNYDWIP